MIKMSTSSIYMTLNIIAHCVIFHVNDLTRHSFIILCCKSSSEFSCVTYILLFKWPLRNSDQFGNTRSIQWPIFESLDLETSDPNIVEQVLHNRLNGIHICLQYIDDTDFQFCRFSRCKKVPTTNETVAKQSSSNI